MAPIRSTDSIAGLRPACRQDAGAPNCTGTAGVSPALAEAGGGEPLLWRSRGYLPHLDAPDLIQHIVFRLADSLPTALQHAATKMPMKERVAAIDAALDSGRGRCELSTPVLAETVETALLAFDAKRYALIAWCVMPNHVHALVQIKRGHALDRIVHSWKSYTSKVINLLLGRTGPFWAPEYFDRFMRDDGHLARTVAYIEGNPVKAGLCENISDWRFSSAWQGWGGRDARGPNADFPD
jgi:REP element-mobilizing transposase RayT